MTSLAFNTFLASLLCVPGLSLAARWRRRALLLLWLALLAAMVSGGMVAANCLWSGTTVKLDLSAVTPFPFILGVDRLSAFFLLLISLVSTPVVLFSASYIERHYEGPAGLWICFLLPWFLLSMVVVVTAGTGFAFLAGWELMTLTSAALVMTGGDSEERRHNIFVYLLMMHAGAAAVFGAFLIFLPQASGLDFAAIRSGSALMSPGLRAAVFLLAFVGFGTKAGIVPLHLWLPRAHPIAPSPVSALMSGVMLKTAVYGFVRFTFDFLGTGPSWWGYLVVTAGALSGLLGLLYALSEHDLKRLLAYSSVENLGVIYLGLGAALVLAAHHAPEWAALALCAALLHSLNHAVFKSLLFLGAGAVSDAAHTLDIEQLGGLLRRMPASGTAFLIACCSIAGLPPGNGFISEWLAFRSFLAAATLDHAPAAVVLPLMTGVLALIGGLAAACFAKVYGVAFLGRPRSDQAEQAREVPLAMLAAMAFLSAVCLGIGIVPGFILRPLGEVAMPLLGAGMLPNEAAALAHLMPWLAAALAVGLILAASLTLRRAQRTTPTWACGLPGLDSRMQYTATAFSKPLRRVFAMVYRPDRTVEVLPAGQQYFSTSISYRSVRTTSFEKALYRPAVEAIVSAGHRMRRLQTGNIQVYLLYLFLALIGVLVFMRFA